jgi:hypothetical protein
MASSGRAYVCLGGASGPSPTQLIILTGDGGNNDNFGISVSGTGDLNGDGFGDIVIGAYGVMSFAGRAYVRMGGTPGLSSTLPSVTLTGPDGIGGYFGFSVASALQRDLPW